MNADRGQALFYFLIMMVVLVMSWAMIVNIAKLLRDRIMMQNAADNAVYSAAVYRARTLNLIGQLNELMASMLAAGAYPNIVPVPMYSCETVGGTQENAPYPFRDYKCTRGVLEYHVDYGGVLKLRFVVNKLIRFQQMLVYAYIPQSVRIAQEIGRRQEANADGEYTGADVTVLVPGNMVSSVIEQISGGGSSLSLSDTLSSLTPAKQLGLRRIRQKITYYKTINTGFFFVDHVHLVWPRIYCQDTLAWFRMDSAFHQQKLVAISVKRPQSPSNRGYPWFGRFIGLGAWPPIITVAAAAVYNTAGPMFPDIDNPTTGVSVESRTIAEVALAGRLGQLAFVAEKMTAILGIGDAAAAALATLIAKASYDYVVARIRVTITNNPVRAYEKARSGGWDAHLVPIGEAPLRH